MRESKPVAFVTVNEAAARTGHHPATIRRWAAVGKIDAIKSGRDWLLTTTQVKAIPLSKNKRKP